MNYTSIEQSKKLLELGLSPESADACYDVGAGQTKAHIECENFTSYFTNDEYPELKDRYVPCWSIGALLEMMPIEFALSREHIKGEIKYRTSYLFEESCESGYFEGHSYLDACYKTVVWLLENNYIKTE